MSIVTEVIIFMIVESVLEMLLWGTGGYLILRFLNSKIKYWQLEILLILVIYLLYDYWVSQILLAFDFSIGNPEITRVFGDINEIAGIDETTVIIAFLQVSIGYLLGKYLYKRHTKETKMVI